MNLKSSLREKNAVNPMKNNARFTAFFLQACIKSLNPDFAPTFLQFFKLYFSVEKIRYFSYDYEFKLNYEITHINNLGLTANSL